MVKRYRIAFHLSWRPEIKYSFLFLFQQVLRYEKIYSSAYHSLKILILSDFFWFCTTLAFRNIIYSYSVIANDSHLYYNHCFSDRYGN
jgi:hypothetical protein